MGNLPLLLAFLCLPLIAPQPLYATKQCSPDSWLARHERPSNEWAQLAKWVAVGKVTARKRIIKPYPNCHLSDQSKCAMLDTSIVTLTVTRWEKGGMRGAKRLKLVAAYCAPPPPKNAGETFRFYGLDPDSYIYFQKLSP